LGFRSWHDGEGTFLRIRKPKRLYYPLEGDSRSAATLGIQIGRRCQHDQPSAVGGLALAADLLN
jgi:hypothetical protein